MKSLQNILTHVSYNQIIGAVDRAVSSIVFDSRQTQTNSLFVAIEGHATNGHLFIQKAIESGAKTIVCQYIDEVNILSGITYVLVENSAFALALIAANFYDHPSKKIKVTAITGTNGKTTVATLSYKLFQSLGYKCGLISTIKNEINGKILTATRTTPDAITIQQLLSQMLAEGCTHCFMEASSHALDQHRVSGIQIEVAVFTNITHDHLDYHKTFDLYIKAKKKLFDALPATAVAIINIDDKRGKIMVQNTKALVKFYSLFLPSDYKALILENELSGMILHINGIELHSPLVGNFNAQNILAIYAIADSLGIDSLQALTAISTLQAAEGRFENYISPQKKIIGIIDYAHTPDALKNVLTTIKSLRTHNEQLITIVGCGGNRDIQKRPEMANIACALSDKVILTSDNPRNEMPDDIIDDMMKGVDPSQFKKVLRITNRKEAIRTACSLAAPKDLILIAGKGHEKYQEIEGIKYPFDDKAVLWEVFKEMNL